MTLVPDFRIGWLNGWLLLAICYGLFGLLLRVFPPAVVRRLYDRSGWTPRDYAWRAVAAPLALSLIGLFVFLPLRLGTTVFWTGLAIYAAGLAVFLVALFNYRATPLDMPVRRGLYRLSRNPQNVGLWLVFLGTAVSVGSWPALGLVLLLVLGQRSRILAEERACLAQYGPAYAAYMAEVPRYAGWPRRPPTAEAAGEPQAQ